MSFNEIYISEVMLSASNKNMDIKGISALVVSIVRCGYAILAGFLSQYLK